MSNGKKEWVSIGDVRQVTRDGVKKTRVVLKPYARIQLKDKKTGEWKTVDVDQYGTTYLKDAAKMSSDIEGLLERNLISEDEAEKRKARLTDKGIKY